MGVNTAYFIVSGGNGGSESQVLGPSGPPALTCPTCGLAVPISATVTLNDGFYPSPVTAVTIDVGGDGGFNVQTDNAGRTGGPGGYNGGGPGGEGSFPSDGGSGGGGATTVTVAAGGPFGAGTVLVVGGGGGGAGGYRFSDTSCGYISCGTPGGTGGMGGLLLEPGGVWAGGLGTSASADNSGGGGAGSNQADGNGGSGGEAEDVSGNAGGGGGGGGWQGGSGGEPGEGGVFGTSGPGGGGGGGSSYANPPFTANVSVDVSKAGYDAGVVIQWVDITTTKLRPMRPGRPTNQQLGAIYANDGNAPLTWQVTGGPSGALPGGLELSETGQLTGTPRRAGSYSFQVTVTSADGLATSVVTYAGTVCGLRCGSRR